MRLKIKTPRTPKPDPWPFSDDDAIILAVALFAVLLILAALTY